MAARSAASSEAEGACARYGRAHVVYRSARALDKKTDNFLPKQLASSIVFQKGATARLAFARGRPAVAVRWSAVGERLGNGAATHCIAVRGSSLTFIRAQFVLV